MTAPRVTRCPHCKTSFRITDAQLRAANGSVRCGSCLQVFDALPNTEHPEQKAPAHTGDNLTHSNEPQRQNAQWAAEVPTPSPPSDSAQNNQEDGQEHDYQSQAMGQLLQELEQSHHQPDAPSPLKKHLPWSLCILFLSALLLSQYAWFNRNSLSLNPVLRPSFEWVCQQLNCTLPPQINTQAIKSMQLVVRSHPDRPDALHIDAIIINNAQHPQPFPKLALAFTDINGRLVAHRVFRPREYLGGELTGYQQMPVGQPIRLGLEIMDPGSDAVNYQLSFRQ